MGLSPKRSEGDNYTSRESSPPRISNDIFLITGEIFLNFEYTHACMREIGTLRTEWRKILFDMSAIK